MRIEAQSENGRIAKAWASSTQFRGIETIMEGRDPPPPMGWTKGGPAREEPKTITIGGPAAQT